MKPQEWRRSLGRRGEELAASYLEKKGYLILQRNYRSGAGEMDIVAQEGDCLVFVEVRARSTREYGTPEESITPSKAQRLIEVAQGYLQEQGESAREWRIDLVAIQLRGDFYRLNHVVNAVTGDGL
ncbi:MAG: YraN family protein [Anaerolineae bacterium]